MSDVRAPDRTRWERLVDDEELDSDILEAMERSRITYTKEAKYNDQIKKLKEENLKKEEKFRKEQEENMIKQLEINEKLREIRKNKVSDVLETIKRLCRIEPKEKYICDKLILDFERYIDSGELITPEVYSILVDEMKISLKKTKPIEDIFQDDIQYYDDPEYEEDDYDDYDQEDHY